MHWIKKTQTWLRHHPWLLGAALTGAILVFGCDSMLRFVGAILIRNDIGSHDPGPAMILMGDGTSERADAALSLFRQGQISAIVIASTQVFPFVEMNLQPATESVHREYLLRHGVPGDKIVFLTGCYASSTIEEVSCLKEYWEQQKIEAPPIIVTSWYHTSRAGWASELTFERDVIMVPAIRKGGGPDNWWKNELDFISVFNEYLKWLYYLLFV